MFFYKYRGVIYGLVIENNYQSLPINIKLLSIVTES